MVGMNGSDLYSSCTSKDVDNIARCEGYILGVQDSIYSGHLSQHFNLCFPQAVKATQIRLQLVQFIEKNPDLMHFAGEGLVAKTLELKYACKDNNPPKE